MKTDDPQRINILVATKIMGWYKESLVILGDCLYTDIWWHHNLGDPKNPRSGASVGPLPNYVGYIGDTWLIVERLYQDKMAISLWGAGEDGYIAQFTTESTRRAATAPLAICLAALAAKEIA